MQKIKLNEDLFERVYSGLKTATTRRGPKKYTLGNAVFVNPNDEAQQIKIKIEQLSLVRYGSIKKGNSYLYHYEGYRDRKDFCEALENIYGDIDTLEQMTIVYFKLR